MRYIHLRPLRCWNQPVSGERGATDPDGVRFLLLPSGKVQGARERSEHHELSERHATSPCQIRRGSEGGDRVSWKSKNKRSEDVDALRPKGLEASHERL